MRTLSLLLLLGLLLAPPGVAPAQHYGHGYGYNYYSYYPCNSYYGSPYQAHYYGNYGHGQQYHYGHNPYYAPQKVLANEVAVAPLIVTVPVEAKALPVQAYGSPYYYSTSEAYQLKSAVRDVLREELRNLSGGGGAQTAAPRPPTQTQQQPAQQQRQQPQQQSKAWQADDRTPAELQAKVLTALSTKRANCLSCHGGGDKDAGRLKLVLVGPDGKYQLVKQDSGTRWKMYGMSSVGAMPPAAASDANLAMESQYLPVLLEYARLKD